MESSLNPLENSKPQNPSGSKDCAVLVEAVCCRRASEVGLRGPTNSLAVPRRQTFRKLPQACTSFAVSDEGPAKGRVLRRYPYL